MSAESKVAAPVGGHTPGPWIVVEGDWGVGVHAPNAATAGTEYPIAENINGDSRREPKNATPLDNARLIAAAPKLLEALQAALPYLRDEADKYEDDGSNEPLEALRDAEDAIARATGAAS